MNEKLIVKNFGPIKNAELDLKKVTVFIGPQGSGKSTLAKLVAIFKDENFVWDSYILKNNNNYFKKFQVDYYLKENVFLNLDTDDYTIYFEKNTPLMIDIPSSFQIEFKNDNDNFRNQSFPYFENSNINEMQNLQRHINKYNIEKIQSFANNVLPFLEKKIKEQTNKIKYLTTDRLLISSISDSILGLLRADVALQKSTTEFGGDFEIARSNIPEIKIDYLNITYKYENGRNLVFYNETDSVPLSASASGHQSTIPLHLTVEHFSKDGNTHFIVEEPELNLFPTTQNKLVGYLADKCTQNGNELLMTTHSPYVLSAINNLIFAYKVAHEVPEKAEEVAQIIPREQWLNPEDVAAYYVADGTVKSIIAEKYGLIGENELDAISEDIAGERDDLFRILKSKKRETVN